MRVPTADAVAAPASNIRERVQAKEENFFMIYPSPSFISCRRQSFLSADRLSHSLIYLTLSTIFAKQSCGKTDAYGIISDLLCKSLQEISSALPVSTEEEARTAPRHDCKAIENTRRELPAPGRRSSHGLCALAHKLHVPIT
ncbi:MAG TPA: hypothetical protein VLT16_04600 [Candidatus Limnocylindrales bacterium]|nr:hypothetical protein [Candidatus Limnocylindrales bacterium]